MSRPGLIVAGGSHNLVVTEKGELIGWGSNSHGQVGDGTFTDVRSPVIVFEGEIYGVGAGRYHSLVAKESGEVWAWGNNEEGLLVGVDMPEKQTVPAKVRGITSPCDFVSGGMQHSLALSKKGEVFAWGGNEYGQLGDGTLQQRRTPVKVIGGGVKAVAAGWYHSVALADGGEVLIWGFGASSMTCHSPCCTPILVQTGGVRIKEVACGAYHNLALSESGVLMVWGGNEHGQLGDGTTKRKLQPVEIAASISTVSAGEKHSVVVTELSEIYMFGKTFYGPASGPGEWRIESSPYFLDLQGGGHTASCGDSHSLLLNNGGEVWAWGDASTYQIGNRSVQECCWPRSALPGGTVEIIPQSVIIAALLAGPKEMSAEDAAAQDAAAAAAKEALKGKEAVYALAQPGHLAPRTAHNVFEPSEEYSAYWGTETTERLLQLRADAIPEPKPPAYSINGKDENLMFEVSQQSKRPVATPPKTPPKALSKAGQSIAATLTANTTMLKASSTSALELMDQQWPYNQPTSKTLPGGFGMQLVGNMRSNDKTANDWTMLGFTKPGDTKPGQGRIPANSAEIKLAVPDLLQIMEAGESEMEKKRRERGEIKRAARAARDEEAAFRKQLERVQRAMKENPRLQMMTITPPERVAEMKPYCKQDLMSLIKSCVDDILMTSIAMDKGETKWIKDKAILDLISEPWKPIIIVKGMMITHWPKRFSTPAPHQTIEDCPCRLKILGQDDLTWIADELEDMRYQSDFRLSEPIARSPEWLLQIFGTIGTHSTFPQGYGPNPDGPPALGDRAPKDKGPPIEPPALLSNLALMGLGSGGLGSHPRMDLSLEYLYQNLKDPRKAVRYTALEQLGRLAPKNDKRAFNVAIEMLKDEDHDVRKKATVVIPQIGADHEERSKFK